MIRTGFVIYLLLIGVALAVIGWRFQDGLPLNTNIVAMLPQSEEAEWVSRAEAAERALGSDQLIALVGHADFETARAAALDLNKALIEAGIFRSTKEEAPVATLTNLNKALFPHRH